jgi:hypothetical protein
MAYESPATLVLGSGTVEGFAVDNPVPTNWPPVIAHEPLQNHPLLLSSKVSLKIAGPTAAPPVFCPREKRTSPVPVRRLAMMLMLCDPAVLVEPY